MLHRVKKSYLLSVILILIMHSCILTLNGQETLKRVDLGIFSGETKFAIRTTQLEGKVAKKDISSSEFLNVETIEFDSIQNTTNTVLRIDVRNRIGDFSDTLLVYDQSEVLIEQLIFSYKILDPVGDVFKSYRNEFWPFRSKQQVFNLQVGRVGDTLMNYFDLYNFSGLDIDLNEAIISDSLLVQFQPSFVANNSFTRMYLSLLSTDESELGFKRQTVALLDEDDTVAFLPIQYSLVPAIKNSAARLSITKNIYDYKVVSKGDLISEVILISNVGREPLRIFKVESDCECLSAEVSKDEIAPNENAQLRVKFNTEGRGGLERKTISLFTNDPESPVQNIVIKAHVK